jgi:DNA-binding GntR family transcriptional regulator
LLTILERTSTGLTADGAFRRMSCDRRPHRTERVAEVLREAIGTGRLLPGERLVEKHIAAELGTSRAPVRDALRELVHEGLVLHTPYRGSSVLGVSEEEVHSVLIPIRLTREGYGFVRALDHLGRADLAELELIVAVMDAATIAGDLRAVVDADVRFHETVLEASQLPHTTQIWRSISPRIRVYFFRYDRDRDLAAVVDEHRELLDAIRAGDRDGLDRLRVEQIDVSPPPPVSAAGEGDQWQA